MNADDARIAAVYAAQSGATVNDITPNSGPPRAGRYDLIVQLEAGNVLGQSRADYTLNFTAINENTGLPAPGLVPGSNPFSEEFDGPAGPQWQPDGTDFVRTGNLEPMGIMRYRITIPPGLTGRFHYNLEFVSAGFQVVALGQSGPFILV